MLIKSKVFNWDVVDAKDIKPTLDEFVDKYGIENVQLRVGYRYNGGYEYKTIGVFAYSPEKK